MILLNFNDGGVIPRSRHCLHMWCNGIASSSLQFLNRIAGKPSGPGAAFSEISLIACFTSSGVNSMSLRVSGSFSKSSFGSIGGSFGVLKTDEY